MRSQANALFALIGLSLPTFTTATPVDPFPTLTCHCISFAPARQPIPCPIPGGSKALNWPAARRLASHRQMKIQFATQDTVTRVLAAETPLPTSVLLSLSNEQSLALEQAGSLASVQKIICGVDDEVRQRWRKSQLHGSESGWFVLQVVVSLVLLIVLYEACEVAWTTIRSWYFARYPPIWLVGEEKLLSAAEEAEVLDPFPPEKELGQHLVIRAIPTASEPS